MLLSSPNIIIKDEMTYEDYKSLFWFFQDIKSIRFLDVAKRIQAYDNPGELESDFRQVAAMGAKICPIYIWGYENTFIGYIVLDEKNGEIGIYLGQKYQGKNYGKESMKMMVEHVFKDTKIKKLTARVCKENTAAIRLFEGMDFKEKERKEKECPYMKKTDDGWAWRESDLLILEVTKEEYGKPKDKEMEMP